MSQDDLMVAGTAINAAQGRGARTGQDPVIDEAIGRAFDAYGGEMLGFARKSVSTASSAEDVVQETFARAWRSRGRFDPALGSLRTWLFSIERRVLLDQAGRQARTGTVPLREQDEPVGVEGLEAAVSGWQVDAALEALSLEHRRILDEIYFQGRTGPQVARRLGIPEGTVRSRAFYALRMLRVILDEQGWEP
jgi:RNA polymerase sigma-70 factor (ECF subfamily)